MNVVFFTDRDLGLQFPAILREAGLSVERHGDHFAHDCQDVVWLSDVAARGWVVLTHDARIRYKPNELAAIVQNKAILLAGLQHQRVHQRENRGVRADAEGQDKNRDGRKAGRSSQNTEAVPEVLEHPSAF